MIMRNIILSLLFILSFISVSAQLTFTDDVTANAGVNTETETTISGETFPVLTSKTGTPYFEGWSTNSGKVVKKYLSTPYIHNGTQQQHKNSDVRIQRDGETYFRYQLLGKKEHNGVEYPIVKKVKLSS